MTEINEKSRLFRHWPTITLGIIVAAIFIIALFSYQVKSTETALVATFGNIGKDSVKGAGFHLRWPYPIQTIHKFDKRFRAFDGSVGKIEEAFTKDGMNVIVGIYVIYNIVDPVTFYKSVVTIAEGEERLNSIMRSMKDSVFGRYNFSQLVNTDPAKMKITEIENEIKKKISALAEKEYGLHIESVGIKSIGIPEEPTKEVFNRMKAEREVVAKDYRSEGKKIADNIRNEAKKQRELRLADAKAKAKNIRAEGDAAAASYYAAFRKDPELAAFLRKLDSLRKIMGTKTTLILDTESVPFDLLRMEAGKVNKARTEPAVKK